MKIIMSSNCKKTIIISKVEWQSIGKKAGWIKFAQNANLVPAYHASFSGANDEVVNSFKTEGAKAIGQGLGGQGNGFYMWCDKKMALNHIDKVQSGELTGGDGNIKKANGSPLIITCMIDLDPKLFDIDYEVHGKRIHHFLMNNQDAFKSIPDGAIVSPEYGKCYPSRTQFNGVSFALSFDKSTGGHGGIIDGEEQASRKISLKIQKDFKICCRILIVTTLIFRENT